MLNLSAIWSATHIATIALGCLVALAGTGFADPVIFAAASTRAVLDSALGDCGCADGISYGASGTIARQIAQGAPADVFVSANPAWMDYLIAEGVVDASDVSVLASNRLVLIGREGEAVVDLTPEDIAGRLGREFFAIADPEVAPVGQYGREALISLGVWDKVAGHVLPTHNTLATVTAVQRGEAALGLVYRSDATGVDGVSIVAEIPASSHAPIHYLIASVSDATGAVGADAVVSFLSGAAGQRHFKAFGFQPVEETGS